MINVKEIITKLECLKEDTQFIRDLHHSITKKQVNVEDYINIIDSLNIELDRSLRIRRSTTQLSIIVTQIKNRLGSTSDKKAALITKGGVELTLDDIKEVFNSAVSSINLGVKDNSEVIEAIKGIGNNIKQLNKIDNNLDITKIENIEIDNVFVNPLEEKNIIKDSKVNIDSKKEGNIKDKANRLKELLKNR